MAIRLTAQDDEPVDGPPAADGPPAEKGPEDKIGNWNKDMEGADEFKCRETMAGVFCGNKSTRDVFPAEACDWDD